jgi:Zn-finger nucleic acid-binding protein
MSAVVNRGALDVRCPNCRSGMGRLSFTAHNSAAVDIDVCWPCHMIWFDGYESTSLSSDSVVDFFKRIHEAQSAGGSANRNIISLKLGCPRCSSAPLCAGSWPRQQLHAILAGEKFHSQSQCG